MAHRPFFALIAATALGLMPLAASALPGDHLIVPGERIGAAELEPADQGALVRALGEPDETTQRGDHEFYRYGAPPSDALTIEFDLAKDAPFEISTTSPLYRTRQGLGVGSAASAVRAALGAPLCEDGNEGSGLLVYGTIRFSILKDSVTRVAIRRQPAPADFQAGPVHC
jgi:hypothetical protein